jgi:hypothetical protein
MTRRAKKTLSFTKPLIESLPNAAPGKRDYYRDARVRGLQLMVTDHGSKTFAVYRRIAGRPTRYTLGRFPDLTPELARRKAEGILGKVAFGEDVVAEDRKTVAEARAWLTKMWARIRAQFKRSGVLVYGFRISEPHHDGTPHMHVLLWMPASDRVRVRRIIRGHMWSEFRDEAGMRRRRFNTKAIHPKLGSAVGYLAKYIAKNVDGFNVGDDHEAETDAKSGSRRAEAWATCHRIRQFQQIGGPPVGLWREFRRLRTTHRSEAVERVRRAADTGDWSAFITALGGIEASRRGPFSLWKENTGEVGRYGEVRSAQVAGIQGPAFRIRTRCQVWRVRWGVRSHVFPWTRGNKCTRRQRRAADDVDRQNLPGNVVGDRIV